MGGRTDEEESQLAEWQLGNVQEPELYQIGSAVVDDFEKER